MPVLFQKIVESVAGKGVHDQGHQQGLFVIVVSRARHQLVNEVGIYFLGRDGAHLAGIFFQVGQIKSRRFDQQSHALARQAAVNQLQRQFLNVGVNQFHAHGGGLLLAVDAEGGCFAAGLGVVQGDWDIAFWRADSAGTLSLADTYDYRPNPEDPHTFSEFANDVLIDGDRVWIVGVSTGLHDKVKTHTRGVIVPMTLDTGEVITANVIVAPKLGAWEHSVFFGAALDDEGNVFATGYGRDDGNNKYRIETSRYSPEGQRTAHAFHNEQNSLAYGSDVALDSQGRAHVAGAVTKNGILQGYLFSRSIASGVLVFEQWFPGTGASEALGMLVNTYDRIVPAGYITTNGTTAARIVLIHG